MNTPINSPDSLILPIVKQIPQKRDYEIGWWICTDRFLKGIIWEVEHPASWDLTEKESVLRAFRSLQKKTSYLWSFFFLLCWRWLRNEASLFLGIIDTLTFTRKSLSLSHGVQHVLLSDMKGNSNQCLLEAGIVDPQSPQAAASVYRNLCLNVNNVLKSVWS